MGSGNICAHVERCENLGSVAGSALRFNDAPRTTVRVDERLTGPDPQVLGLMRPREPQKYDSPDPDVVHGNLVHAVSSVEIDMLTKARASRVVEVWRAIERGSLHRMADEPNAVDRLPGLALVEMERGTETLSRPDNDCSPLITG